MKFVEGEINPSTHEYKMKAEQSQIVFGDILTVNNAKFTFEWTTSISSGLKVTIDGRASVNDRSYTLKAVKGKEDDVFAIEKYEGDMVETIISYIGGFDHTVDQTSIAGVHDGVDFAKIEAIQWSNTIHATGHISITGSFQLVFYSNGDVNHITAFGGNSAALRMIMTRKSKATSISLVAIFGEGTDPGGVVDGFLIDKNPDDAYIQRIRNKQFSVIMTKDDINIKVFPAIQAKIDELFQIAFPTEIADKTDLKLKSGVAINIEIDVRSEINTCLQEMREESDIDISDLTETYPKVTLSGHFLATGIQFGYPEAAKMPMKEFMMCAAKDPRFIDLPQNIFDADISKGCYVYDYFKSTSVKTLTLRCKHDPLLSIDRLRIDVTTIDIGFTATVEEEDKKEDEKKNEKEENKNEKKIPSKKKRKNNQGKNDARLKSSKKKRNIKNLVKDVIKREKKSSKVKYELAITANAVGQGDNKPKVCACTASIPFESFECTIHIADMRITDFILQLFPSDIAERMVKFQALDTFYKSGFKDLAVTFSMGNTRRLGATGTLILGSYENFHFEYIYYVNAGWAIGVAVTQIPLEEIINFFLSYFNVQISIPWLDKLDGAFIYSTIDIEAIEQMESEESSGKANKNTNRERKENIYPKPEEYLESLTSKLKNKSKTNESYVDYENPLYKLNASTPTRMKQNFKKVSQSKRYQQRLFNRAAANQATSSKQTDGEASEPESEEDAKKKLFSLSLLRDFEISKGIKMKLDWIIPPERDCKDNSICIFLAKKLPSTKLTLQVEFTTSPVEFKLIAGISTDISMTDSLKFTGANLEISFGTTLDKNYIEISATLRYIGEHTTLDFKGSIKATASGKLELTFGMQGFVYPFDSDPAKTDPFFRLGNFHLGLSLDLKKLSFKIEIGAEVQFGKVYPHFDVNAAVSLKGYVGLDLVHLSKSWVYAQASKFTLGVLCRMFGINTLDGTRFDEMGLKYGFLFTYNPALEAKEIEVLDKTIPPGIHVAGGISFLWIEAKSELTIDLKQKKFNLKIDMSPIVWLEGLIKVVRSSDETKGPYCYINYEPTKSLIMRIDGKVRLFGMMYEVDITINDEQISFKVGGTIIPGLLDGDIQVTSVLGSNNFQSFTVTVGVRISEFAKKLGEYLTKFLEGARKVADAIVKKTEELQASAEQIKENVQAKIANMQQSVASWKQKLIDRRDKLIAERTSKKDYEYCVADCKDIYIGFLEWKGHCWKVWGHWIGCPWWNPRKWRVKNIFCLAKCELLYLKTAFLEWLNETINKLKIVIAEVAGSFLNLFEDLTTALGNMVQQALELVKTVGKAAKAVMCVLIKMLQFELNKFELRVSMGSNFNYCFSFALDMYLPFFDLQIDISHERSEICLNEILLSLLKMIFGKEKTKLNKVTDFDNNKSANQGRVRAVEREQEDVKEEEEKVDTEVKSEMEKNGVEDATQRDMLPGEKTFQYLDYAKAKYNHSFTDEQRDFLHTSHEMKNSYKIPKHMLHAFNEKSAWVLAENHVNNKSHDFVPLQELSDKRVRRSLEIDEKSSPCDRMKRTLQSYSDITNGLMTSVNNMEYGKQQMKIERREHIDNLHDLHKHTHKLGTRFKNYTPKQKRQIHFWYKTIKKGYDYHHRINKRNIAQHDQDAIATYRSHLNTIISGKKRSTFHDHIDEMHEDAIKGYRRSALGNPENDGEQGFHDIRKDLKAVLTKDLPLSRLKRHLNKINKNIRKMNQHVSRCQ